MAILLTKRTQQTEAIKSNRPHYQNINFPKWINNIPCKQNKDLKVMAAIKVL